jgi:hypothetical protein
MPQVRLNPIMLEQQIQEMAAVQILRHQAVQAM